MKKAGLLFATLWLSCELASAASLTTVQERGAETVAAIRSIEYSYTFAQNQFRCKLKLAAAGDLFRVDRSDQTLMSTTMELRQSISAFDGTHTQKFDSSKSRLSYSDGNSVAYPIPDMYVMLYEWLFEAGQDRRFETLGDVSAWRRRFSGAKAVDTDELEVGYVFVEFPEDRRGSFRVKFVTNRGVFPESWERFVNGELAATCYAEEYNFDHGVFVPFVVRGNTTDGDEAAIRIDPGSLKANHEVDRDYFTIPLSMASSVLDEDEEYRQETRIIAERKNRGDVDFDSNPNPIMRYLIYLNLLVFVVVVAAILYKRHSRATR